jgi:hypothetical protein
MEDWKWELSEDLGGQVVTFSFSNDICSPITLDDASYGCYGECCC